MGDRFRFSLHTTTFVLLAAGLNTALYHLPLFSFATRNLDLSTFSGILTLISLPVALFLGTAILLTLLALVSRRLLRPLCMVLAAGNAVALYFLLTYHVVLDSTMMGNVFNTDFAEAAEYLHPTLIGYLLALGVLPCWLITRVRLQPSSRLRLAVTAAAGVLITVGWAYLTASTWLWIDANSKRLGGMVLPWSYVINAGRYELPRMFVSGVQEPLPPATFASTDKTVVMLVIGEAARERNFALYGYDRPTNPLLSNAGVVVLRNPSSCATYTTAAVRCILSNVDSKWTFARPYEPLPSYLQRNGVDVIWRTHNFGEPPLKVQTYQKAVQLSATCTGAGCAHDEVLLSGLEQRIVNSSSRRIFVVLHQSGSHGPSYYTKYPERFEHFKPVCKSVELSRCTGRELVNAYDNTILYEDYFLFQVIGILKRLQHTSALLLYLSDHGESLGEYGLYLHGVPYAIAPDVQKEIPFIVWMSDEFVRHRAVDVQSLESQTSHSQRDIFHTVMGAFTMHSDAYMAEYDIFSKKFSNR
ncbi:MAG TPA: phosphoethanolamine--lipid A transferase EptA [Thermoanaerobaculia bacterium]